MAHVLKHATTRLKSLKQDPNQPARTHCVSPPASPHSTTAGAQNKSPRIMGASTLPHKRKAGAARGMRAGARRRVDGHGGTPRMHLWVHQTLYFGRTSRDLPGFSRKLRVCHTTFRSGWTGYRSVPHPTTAEMRSPALCPHRTPSRRVGCGGARGCNRALKNRIFLECTLPFSGVPEEVFGTLR